VINTFENVKAHTTIEKRLFHLGNKIRYKTKKNTIMKYLLFKKGDSVSRTTLIESERNLREQIFLADAKIYLEKIDSTIIIYIMVFDQWATVPLIGMKKIGNEWTHRFGIIENNLIGTGQSISVSHYKSLSTEGNTFTYNNSSIGKYKLKYQLEILDNRNGYSIISTLHKPLISKHNKHGFKIHYSTSKKSLLYYFDGNLLEDPIQEIFNLYGTNTLIEFNNIYENYLGLNYTKSYGIDNKIDLQFFTKFFNRIHNANNYILLNNQYQNYIPNNLRISAKNDAIIGIKVKIYQKEYLQTKNLNNLKWTENLTNIKSISFTIGKNMSNWGAYNDNVYIRWNTIYSNYFNEKHFVFTNSNIQYFIQSNGYKKDGNFNTNINYQYRLTPLINGKISTYLENYFKTPNYQQLSLGESTGLLGYPNFYYSGNALLLIKSEINILTDLEIFTVIPAISIFATSGNTFANYKHINLNKMHSSIGFGLRFGLSKSAGKIVNHINFSWPIHDLLSGPSISIYSKNSL